MRRIIRQLIVLLLAANSAYAAEGWDGTSVRECENFNSDWLFTLGDSPEFREPSFDDSEWRELTLPHDWSIESEYTPDFPTGKNNGFFTEGLGWYRKSFTVAKEDRNCQFVIQFDGVFMNSEVWINGRYLGRRPFGYSTFRYDLTDALKFGGENTIAVRVDNSNPGADRWYHGSGIYRDVHLLKTNYVHFKHNGGVFVKTPVAESSMAVVDVDYDILGTFFTDEEISLFKRNGWVRTESRWRNEPRDHDCIIRSIVYDAEGNEVARTEENHTIKNYDVDYRASQKVTIQTPKRWSAETPYLYTLKSEIEFDGRVLDDVVTKFGVRKIEYLPSAGMFVNGEETKLYGVCLHHEAGSLGAAVPEKSLRYRLEKLKEMGCNALRTAHNPFSPTFYKLCDELGFYVMDEAFDEWTTGWAVNWTENPTGKAMNGYNHLYEQWWRTDLADMIKRDRNHPSVIIYGIGNEIPDYRHLPSAGDKAEQMVALCHEVDPTRYVTTGDNGVKRSMMHGVTEHLDIIGVNYIERDYGEDVLFDGLYEEYPDRLMFGSEVSKELFYFLAVRDKPYVIGSFIWTGVDYLGETKDVNLRGWNTSLLDLTLQKKADGALFEVCWSEEPKSFITTSLDSASAPPTKEVFSEAGEQIVIATERLFTWNRTAGEKIFVIVYSNCDEIELKVNGKSLGRKSVDPDKYYAEFETTYKSGRVEAIGYNGGKKVSYDKLFSTGAPTQIVAKSVWGDLKRDGEDVAIIEVEVADKSGRRVPESKSLVNVTVEGGARLLGVDSANLYYKGLFTASEREATNGTLLVTIQSTGEDLPTKVTLTSDGLKSKILEL
ncbi:MAG: glycoside hydrolase family 2 TIM barrel-domain containing protein [Rikenellaceae bacterium]